MADWKTRLQVEHLELCNRLEPLESYIQNIDNCKDMDKEDWNMLIVQKDAMVVYESVLSARMIKLGIPTITEE